MWWEVWKSVLGCMGSVGIGVGECVQMWKSVWDECGEVCWGVRRGEERCGGVKKCGERCGKVGSGELGS